MVSLNDIRGTFHGTIKLGEPLASYAPLGVGGPADYLLEATSQEECAALVGFFSRQDLPYLVLDEHVVVSDKGFRGAVIVKTRELIQGKRRCATMFKTNRDTPVEVLLERAGVNGLLLGGAEVMGNCVVNVNNATAADVYSIVRRVQEIINSQLGIALETRLQLVGFDQETFARVA